MKHLLLLIAILSVASMGQAENKYEKECLEKAKGSQKVKKVLCEGANNTYPLQCYQKVNYATNSEAAILCNRAKSLQPIACYAKVKYASNLQAAMLCNQAKSTKPINCYAKIKEATNRQAAVVCSGAESTKPIDCYAKAENLTHREAAILCSGVTPNNLTERLNCYRNKKKHVNYKEAVNVCATKGNWFKSLGLYF